MREKTFLLLMVLLTIPVFSFTGSFNLNDNLYFNGNIDIDGNISVLFELNDVIPKVHNVNFTLYNSSSWQKVDEQSLTLESLLSYSDNDNLTFDYEWSSVDSGIYDDSYQLYQDPTINNTVYIDTQHRTSYSSFQNFSMDLYFPEDSTIIDVRMDIGGNEYDGKNVSGIDIKIIPSGQQVWSYTNNLTSVMTANFDIDTLQNELDQKNYCSNGICRIFLEVGFIPGNISISNIVREYQKKTLNTHNMLFTDILTTYNLDKGYYALNISFFNSSDDPFEFFSKDLTVIQPVSSNTFNDSYSIDLDGVDLFNVTDPYFGRSRQAQINWSGNYDLNGYDIDNNLVINDNYIFMNSTNLNNLNTSANITFFDLGYQYDPIIKKRETNDNTSEWQLYNPSNYNYVGGNLVFEVTGFSAYTVGTNSELLIDYSGTLYPNNDINFTANYTNSSDGSSISNADCYLNVSNTIYHMNYSAGNGLYYYAYQFSSYGPYNYSVKCNATGYETLIASDIITIQQNLLPTPYLKFINITSTSSFIEEIYGIAFTTDVDVRVYSRSPTDDPDFEFAENRVIIPFYNVTEYGSGNIYSLPSNPRQINVDHNPIFLNALGNYIYFEGNENSKDDLTGYLVTGLSDLTTYYRLTLGTDRPSAISIGTGVTLTNTSVPKGWFSTNITLAYMGLNEIVAVTNSSTSAVSNLSNEIYVNLTTVPFSVLKVTNITDGGAETSNDTLNFKWKSINSTYFLYYEYVLGTDKYPVSGWNDTLSLQTTSLNYTDLSLDYEIDTMYFLSIRAIYKNDQKSQWTSSDGIMYFDDTPPEPIGVNVSGYPDIESQTYTNNDEFFISMYFDEPDSEIAYYNYEVGIGQCYMQGHDSIIPKTQVVTSTVNTGTLPLINNQTYYANAWAVNTEQIRNASSICIPSSGITYDDIDPYGGKLNYSSQILSTNGTLAYNQNIPLNFNSGEDTISGLLRAELHIKKAPMSLSDGNCGVYGSFSKDRDINPISKNKIFINLTNGYCYKFMARVYDKANNFIEYTPNDLVTIRVDSTPPNPPNVYDDGAWTLAKDIHFTWSGGNDPESGISYYDYSITMDHPYPTGSTLVDWTNVDDPYISEINLLDLDLENGKQYFVNMRAYNNLNNTVSNSSSSNGIYYFDNTPPASIIILKAGNTTTKTPPIQEPYYYDLVNSTKTNISIQAEETDVTCVYSPYDIDYRSPVNLDEGYCGPSSERNQTCQVNMTNGIKTYYIVCEDDVGNQQTSEENVDLMIVKDYKVPEINFLLPEISTNYSNQIIVKINDTGNDLYKYRETNTSTYLSINYSINETTQLNYTINVFVNGTIISNQSFIFDGLENYINSFFEIDINDIKQVSGKNKTNVTVQIIANDFIKRYTQKNLTFVYENQDSEVFVEHEEIVETETQIDMSDQGGSSNEKRTVPVYDDQLDITLNASDVSTLIINITNEDNQSWYRNYTYNASQSQDILLELNTIFGSITGWVEGLYKIFIEWFNDFFKVTADNKDYGNHTDYFIVNHESPKVDLPNFDTDNNHIIYINQTLKFEDFNVTLNTLDDGFANININGTNRTLSLGDSVFESNIYLVLNKIDMIYGFDELSRAYIQIDNKSIEADEYIEYIDMYHYSEHDNILKHYGNKIIFNFSIEDMINVSTYFVMTDIFDTDSIYYTSDVLNIKSKENNIFNYTLNYTPLRSEQDYTIIINSEDETGKISKEYLNLSYRKKNNLAINDKNESIIYVGEDNITIDITSNHSMILAYKIINNTGYKLFYNQTRSLNNVSENLLSINNILNITTIPDGNYKLNIIAIDEYYNKKNFTRDIVVDRKEPEIKYLRSLLSDEFRMKEDENISIFSRVFKVGDINSGNATLYIDSSSKLFEVNDTKTYYPSTDKINVTLKEIYHQSEDENFSFVVVQVYNTSIGRKNYPDNKEGVVAYNENISIHKDNFTGYFILKDNIYKNINYNIYEGMTKIYDNILNVSGLENTEMINITYVLESNINGELNLTIEVIDLFDNKNNLTVPFIIFNSTYLEEFEINKTYIFDQIPERTKGLFNITFNATNVWYINVDIFNKSDDLVDEYSINITPYQNEINSDQLINITGLEDGEYYLNITFMNYLLEKLDEMNKTVFKDTVFPVIDSIELPEVFFAEDFNIKFNINDTDNNFSVYIIENSSNMISNYPIGDVDENMTILFSAKNHYPGDFTEILILVNDTAGNVGNYTFNYTPVNRRPLLSKPTYKSVSDINITYYYDEEDNRYEAYQTNLDYDNNFIISTQEFINEVNDSDGLNSSVYIYDKEGNLNISFNSYNKTEYLLVEKNGSILNYFYINYTINNSGMNFDHLGLKYYNLSDNNVINEYNITFVLSQDMRLLYNENFETIIRTNNTGFNYYYYNQTDNITFLSGANFNLDNGIKYGGKFYSVYRNNTVFLKYNLISINMTDKSLSNRFLFNSTDNITNIEFNKNVSKFYYVNESDERLYEYDLITNLSKKLNYPKIESLNEIDYIIEDGYILIRDFDTFINYDLLEDSYYKIFDEVLYYQHYDVYNDTIALLYEDDIYKRKISPEKDVFNIIPENDYEYDQIITSSNYTIDLNDYITHIDDNDLFNLTYESGNNMTINILNDSLVFIPDNGFKGETWAILNFTDSFGESVLTGNITIDVGGTQTFNLNINSTKKLNVTYYDNINDFVYQNSLENYTQSLELINTTRFDLIINPNKTYHHFGLLDMNVSLIKDVNVSYENHSSDILNHDVLRLGNDTDILFEGDRYKVLDSYAVEIEADGAPYYFVEFDYTNLTSQINNESRLVVIKYEYDLVTNNVTYSNYEIFDGVDVEIDILNHKVKINPDSFSLFVLAEDLALAEICGDGIDQDYDGDDLDCDQSPPPQDPPIGGNDDSDDSDDSDNSGSPLSSPTLTTTEETCFDNIKNQDETNIDCGGVCGGYYYDGTCNINPEPETDEPLPTEDKTSDGIDKKSPIVKTPVKVPSKKEEEKDKSILSLIPSLTTLITGLLIVLLIGGFAGTVYYMQSRRDISDNRQPEMQTFGLEDIPSKNNVMLEDFEMEKIKLDDQKDQKDENIDSEKKDEKVDMDLPQQFLYDGNEELYGLVEEMIKKNISIDQIQEALLQKGYGISEVLKVYKDLNTKKSMHSLSNFIKKLQGQGMSDDAIKKHLVNARWAPHFVEMIMHDAHIISEDIQRVEVFVSNMIKKGFDKMHIKDALTQAGWKPQIIEPLLED